MDDRQPPPPRNSSRTLAIAAVAVLVVIAIAGIVLASLRGRGAPADASAAADATQPAASAMTAPDASALKAEADAGPNQVVFAPESDQLSEPATTKLIRFAEAAHKDKRTVIIASKVEVRPERPQEMELAKKRAYAVRGVLEAHGLPLGTMQIQIAELPLGLVPASEANRVELALR